MQMQAFVAALLAVQAASAASALPDNSTTEGNGASAALPLLRRGAAGGARAANASSLNALDAQLQVPAFFWNVHWQCSVGARGSSSSCRDRVAQRFVQLAHEANAQIVTSIELSHGMSEPVSLGALGLEGWTQVNGPCARGSGGDSAALAFAPGWVVEAFGGGCLRHDWDTRAFAVARVTPPSPVRGCSSLCVVALHAPHSTITSGKDIVSSVCGGAVGSCAIAMGDWNVPADGVGRLWAELIGGSAPGLSFPNERSCCFPESQHYGVFDHIATNIPGAGQAGHELYPYQLLEENPVQQHKPVGASLALPVDR